MLRAWSPQEEEEGRKGKQVEEAASTPAPPDREEGTAPVPSSVPEED